MAEEEKKGTENEGAEAEAEAQKIVDAEATAQAEADAEAGSDEPTEIDVLAREMGWNPDYKGLDREFVDSKTYILRSREIQDTMRSQLRVQGDQIDDLKQTVTSGLDNLRQHQEKVSKAEVAKLKNEITSLKTQKRAAVKDGDADLVDELDEQIEGRQAASHEAGTVIPAPPPKTKGAPPPEFAPWVERNPWYKTDLEMTDFADDIVARNPQLKSPEAYARLLKLVDRNMKAEFPDKFEKAPDPPEKKTPVVPTVESGGRRPSGKKTFTKKDLNENQQEFLKKFEKLGVITEAKYIEDLVTTGDLK